MTILLIFAINYLVGIFVLPAIDHKDERFFNWAKANPIRFHLVVTFWFVFFILWLFSDTKSR